MNTQWSQLSDGNFIKRANKGGILEKSGLLRISKELQSHMVCLVEALTTSPQHNLVRIPNPSLLLSFLMKCDQRDLSVFLQHHLKSHLEKVAKQQSGQSHFRRFKGLVFSTQIGYTFMAPAGCFPWTTGTPWPTSGSWATALSG